MYNWYFVLLLAETDRQLQVKCIIYMIMIVKAEKNDLLSYSISIAYSCYDYLSISLFIIIFLLGIMQMQNRELPITTLIYAVR